MEEEYRAWRSRHPRLKKLLFEVVENQLRNNNPPITRITFGRLISDGYTKAETKERIAAAVIGQINFSAMWPRRSVRTSGKGRWRVLPRQRPGRPFRTGGPGSAGGLCGARAWRAEQMALREAANACGMPKSAFYDAGPREEVAAERI